MTMKTIRLKIDGVPVLLNVSSIGPADIAQVNQLENNISKETFKTFDQVSVLSIGDESVSEEKKNEINKRLENEINSVNPEEIVDHLSGIADALQNLNGKKWWTSKTLWANASCLVTIAAAYFGFNFDIDPQVVAAIAGVIMPFINMYLRKVTNEPIAPIKKKKIK